MRCQGLWVAACTPATLRTAPRPPQLSYGYRSFEAFIAAVNDVRAGRAAPRDFDHSLASIHTTFQTTAILEAARVSLDNDGAVVELQYGSGPEARADVPIGMACKALPVAASGDVATS